MKEKRDKFNTKKGFGRTGIRNTYTQQMIMTSSGASPSSVTRESIDLSSQSCTDIRDTLLKYQNFELGTTTQNMTVFDSPPMNRFQNNNEYFIVPQYDVNNNNNNNFSFDSLEPIENVDLIDL